MRLIVTFTALADPAKRRSIVAFVRVVADATEALQRDPEPYWPEMEFPMRIIPDMLDVLETEEAWVALEHDGEPLRGEFM